MNMSLPTPFELWRLSMRSSRMMAEAQAVIGMRMMGMIGLWPVKPDECTKMLSEKLDAAFEAQGAVLRAAMKGGSGIDMVEAALRPVRRRTRANAARLARSAMKQG